ncbi:Uncharacterised protein [Citrobacter braakii]|nr:hypothetical protein I6L52_05500 [Citrobacter braakii]STB40507.1 Uncharacterised protein [Citrobacter braakii]SUX59103.1 Uncharacterised protein [Citrobacter braakii]
MLYAACPLCGTGGRGNNLLAERYGFLPRPSTTAMALGIKETLALDKGIFRDLTQHTDVILKKSYEVLHGGLDNVNSIQSWSNA